MNSNYTDPQIGDVVRSCYPYDFSGHKHRVACGRLYTVASITDSNNSAKCVIRLDKAIDDNHKEDKYDPCWFTLVKRYDDRLSLITE